MRLFKLVALIVLVSMAFSGCAAPAAGGDLKIAILAPLSGGTATFGQSTKEGALMAIDEWNAQGGVLGRMF